MHAKYRLENFKGRDHLEGPATDERTLRWLPELGWKSVTSLLPDRRLDCDVPFVIQTRQAREVIVMRSLRFTGW